MLKIKLKEPSSDLMISLNLRAQEYTSEDSNGLVNQGNTCYMNSYLQTLYHIPAFRNLVYEAEVKDESRFPATLQGLFFNLHHAEKSVSP
jgi:ubiquitin C-terminal hydrolase